MWWNIDPSGKISFLKNAMIKVFGYGSLMSQLSARSTMPSLQWFMPAILHEHKRTFSLVSISGLIRGGANQETLEMAALGINPSPTHNVYGCAFDISAAEMAAYVEREHRYRLVDIHVNIEGMLHPAVTVVPYASNEEYRAAKFADDEVGWHERVGQHYSGPLFDRRDVWPMRAYLRDCLAAAASLGGRAWLVNFLDESFCSDGATSIRSYISAHPDRVSLEDLL